ncbi:Atrial natriuretic peptide receptor 1 [Hypsibius exemplaris]|uniref:guanylate cyclase n=1 Tax=Hypsibius exemplaris TaxID=2072580 RepID=A0A1W0WYL5_HYPEX|nr:Atrial natriuretic peptide receptor 1 [Hypsibius exemplaris]
MDVVNENVLPDSIKFSFVYKDGGKVCAPKSATIGRLMELTAAGVKCNLYLGPGCSEAVLDLYQAAEHENVVIMGIPGAHTSSRSGLPRSNFPNLIRTTYTFVDLGKAVTKFMDLFHYSHVTIITNTESYFYQEMGDNFRSQYRNQRQNLRKITTFTDFTHDQMPPTWTPSMLYAQLLTEANRTSRVILLFANASVVRDIMVVASTIGMANGEHVYMCVELFKSKIWGEFTWQRSDIHDREAHRAFQSLLVISMAEVIGPQMDEFSRILRHNALRDYNYTFGPFERVDPVTMAYVEALFLFGNAVRVTSGAGMNFTDTQVLLAAMRNVTIKSALQNDITIAAIGDRVILYEIKSFDLSSYNAHSVFRMDFVRNQFIWLATLQWPNSAGVNVKELPPDMPVCGYSGLECVQVEKSTTLIVAATVIPILLLAFSATAVAVVYRKLRKDQNPFWWRYHTKDLEFPDQARRSTTMGSSYTVTTKNTAMNNRLLTIAPWKAAVLQGNIVAASPLTAEAFRVSEGLIADLKLLRYMRHQNLHRLIGLCIDDRSWITHIVAELCSKGCLQDVLENVSFKMDWSFKFSFLKDIAQGLGHLHVSAIHSHGFLTSINCLIDGRFVVKIGDCGLTKLHSPSERDPVSDSPDRDYYVLLWRAPELLRVVMSEKGTQQIILRSAPFTHANTEERSNRETHELLIEIVKGVIPPVRPPVSRSVCSVELYDLMERCWSEFPLDRPNMPRVIESIRKISGLSGDNVIDILLNRMEDYSHDLEGQIAEKNLLLHDEKQRLDEITNQFLPRSVAMKLAKGQTDTPQVCPSVTVYNAKLNASFRKLTSSSDAIRTMTVLNEVLGMMDHCVDRHDAAWRPLVSPGNYMIACGLPDDHTESKNHSMEIAKIAVEISEQFVLMPVTKQDKEVVSIQAGIHSGPCVAGIFGFRPPRYCLFGDCVLLTAKFRHLAEPSKIVMSETTRSLLVKEDKDGLPFQITLRGPVDETNPMTTYWLAAKWHDRNGHA